MPVSLPARRGGGLRNARLAANAVQQHHCASVRAASIFEYDTVRCRVDSTMFSTVISVLKVATPHCGSEQQFLMANTGSGPVFLVYVPFVHPSEFTVGSMFHVSALLLLGPHTWCGLWQPIL